MTAPELPSRRNPGSAANVFLASANSGMSMSQVIEGDSPAAKGTMHTVRPGWKNRIGAYGKWLNRIPATAAVGSVLLLGINNYVGEETRHANVIELEEQRAEIALELEERRSEIEFQSKVNEVICTEVEARAYDFGRTQPEFAQELSEANPELSSLQSAIEDAACPPLLDDVQRGIQEAPSEPEPEPDQD